MQVKAANLWKKVRILGVLAGILVVWAPQSRARAAGDVYTIVRLPIDASGPSAAEARDIAMSQGRVEALQQLFRRLTPQTYWGVLPLVSGSDAVSMVAGLQLANEKTSPTRYLAQVTYSFKPARIREALRQANIPFSETQARAAVLLAILDTPEGLFLWQADNPWSQAWKSRSLGNELVPFLLPLGELEDLVSVNAQDALDENWQVLSPFAQRYGVSEVMLARATLQDMDGAQGMQIQMVRLNGGAVPVQRLGLIIENETELPLQDLLNLGIDQVLMRLDETWKRKTIIRSGAQSDLLAATVHFTDLKEWLDIKQRLKRVSSIHSFEIVDESMSGADVMLHFVGTYPQLGISLAQQDLQLLDQDMGTTIVLRSGVEALEPLEGDETTDVISTQKSDAGAGDKNLGDLNVPGSSKSDDATTNDW